MILNIKTNKKPLALLCFLLISINVWAFDQRSNFKFSYLTTEDGLQGQSVYCALQDHLGFIWFGTENGLHRYDGHSFEVFESNDEDSASLSGNVVFDIIQLGEDLLICTNYGLDLYDISKNKFTHVPARIKQGTSIVLDKNLYCPVAVKTRKGDVLISVSDEGVFKFNKDSIWLEKLYLKTASGSMVKTGIITSLFQGENGEIWAGSKNRGVFRFFQDSLKAEIYTIENKGIGSNYIYSVISDINGKVYAGTDKGLYFFDTTANRFIPEARINNRNAKIYTMCRDRKGNIWLGTNGDGIILWTPDRSVLKIPVSELQGEGLNNGFIRTVFEDIQGNIWIGTEQGGINYIQKNNASVFNTVSKKPYSENTLSFNNVAGIMAKSNNEYWLGTDGGGLNLWNIKDNTFKVFDGTGNRNNAVNSILTVAKDKDGDFWVGGYLEGFNKLNINDNTYDRYRHISGDTNSIGHDDVRCILVDSRGRIWIATNGGGLNRFIKEPGVFIKYKRKENTAESLVSNYCITLFKTVKTEFGSGHMMGFLYMILIIMNLIYLKVEKVVCRVPGCMLFMKIKREISG